MEGQAKLAKGAVLEGLDPPRRRRRRIPKLDTLRAVRTEMSRLYREGRNGELETADASKLCHMLGLIRQVLESEDIDRRLQTLEAHYGDR